MVVLALAVLVVVLHFTYYSTTEAGPSGRSNAGIAGPNPAGDMHVSCECCVLLGSGLCVGLISRPVESNRS